MKEKYDIILVVLISLSSIILGLLLNDVLLLLLGSCGFCLAIVMSEE